MFSIYSFTFSPLLCVCVCICTKPVSMFVVVLLAFNFFYDFPVFSMVYTRTKPVRRHAAHRRCPFTKPKKKIICTYYFASILLPCPFSYSLAAFTHVLA